MAKPVQRLESYTSNISSRTNASSNETSFTANDLDYDDLNCEDIDGEYLDSDYSDQDQPVNTRIPFGSIHKEPQSFESSKRRCFLPGQKIHVKVVDAECPDSSRILNPNVYVIDLKHGNHEWTVRRRYKHFRHIHEQMLLFRARLRIPYPTKSHQERRKSFAQRKHRLPNFPKTPDPLVDDMEKRKEELTTYLQELLRYPQYRNHPEVLKFLEVSHLSFVTQLGGKWKEGMVKKRSGGHKFKMGYLKTMKGCVGGCRCCRVWQYRWLILKDSFVAYVDPERGTVRDVILMDRVFKVNCGKDNTKIRHGLVISNMNRKLTLRAWTHRKAKEWMIAIDKAAQEKAPDFSKDNRYDSFAPVREDIPVKWFVDGATYMSAVADALETAKEEIFITDWWLSPEVFMKRPIGDEGAKWRLDVILKRKADEGVKIFVQLYKEMQMALGLNSYYTKETLQNLNPQNIKVLRHPDGIALWSHHEKTVIIDQKIAFLGGIDLCYGRWDTPTHRLHDLGSVGEFNEAEDVPGTLEPSSFDRDSNPSRLPVIMETSPAESADSFRPKYGSTKVEVNESQNYYGSFDEPDKAKIHKKIVTFQSHNGNISQDSKQSNISASDNAVVEGKIVKNKQHSLERQKSAEWSSSAESSESEYETSDESFSENDLESPSRPIHSRKVHSEKSPIKNNAMVTPGDRAKHYSRSSSLPANAEFTTFSYISPPHGYEDSSNNNKKNKKKYKPKSELPVIEDTSESELEWTGDEVDRASSPRYSNDLSTNNSSVDLSSIKMDYMKVPDIVVQPASDTEESQSDRGGSVSTLNDIQTVVQSKTKEYSYSPKSYEPVKSDSASEGTNKPQKTKKKKKKLPQAPKVGERHVIGYATPYEEPNASDCREKFNYESHNISYTNDAFEDSTVSDVREKIVFDPYNTSYTNIKVDSDSEGSSRTKRRDENYNETSNSFDEPADLTALDKLGHAKASNASMTGLLKVDRNLDAISVGEPQSFRDYIKDIQPEETGLLPNGLPTVVQPSARDESGQEEEKQIQKELRKEKKKQKNALSSGNMRKKLTRMKAVEKESDSDSSSDSNNEKRFKDKSKERPKKNKKDKKKHKKDGEHHHHHYNQHHDHHDNRANEDPYLVLSANHLSTPDRQNLSFVSGDKPSTPRPKKKLAQKAQDFRDKTKERTQNLKEDIRSKFLKNRSRSMGVDLDGPDPIETIKFIAEQNEDEKINKIGDDENYKLWIGKDYTNFIFKDFVDLDKPFSDFIDRQATPRMPWHDIGAVVFGKGARDVARHFIQRWNFTKLQKRKDNPNYPLLLPKAYKRVPIPPIAVKDPMVIWCKSQILRSSSHWSAGLRYRECSIQNAYVDLIKHAENYIYIENQFFVSVMNDSVVQNNIAGALYERIIQAHHKGEIFRVYVVLPLLPAFEGELGTATGTSIQAVTHWNYSSICRGGKSLLERLVAAGVLDPFEYISFYGLRHHGNLNGNLISELVYVHSKMMIVDDMKVIIGSANINDRSMNGKRDSEMAIVVEDVQLMNSVLNGKQVKVGKFAHTLRTHLFKEHLGLMSSDATNIDISDPCLKPFYKGIWMKQASVNTDIFEKVFNCLPTDRVGSFVELKEYQKQEGLVKTDPVKAKQLLTRVRGHLVIMPLQFLNKEVSLAPSAGTKESFAPTIIWT